MAARFASALALFIACSTAVPRKAATSETPPLLEPMPAIAEGSGPALVMLPGGTFGAEVYTPHAARLAKSFRVVRVEALNVHFADQGRRLPDDYSVGHETVALAAAVEGQGLSTPVSVMGWSYGGVIALDFALHYPSRVRALILFEPPEFWIVDEDHEDEGLRQIRQVTRRFTPGATITEADVEAFRCALGNCVAGVSIRSDPRWPLWVAQRNRMRGLAANLDHKHTRAELSALRVPVLVMTGSATVGFHRRIDEELVRTFPNARSITLSGGHAAPITAPDELVSAIETFLTTMP